jgi:Mg2+ and Co2+ transporter CorA
MKSRMAPEAAIAHLEQLLRRLADRYAHAIERLEREIERVDPDFYEHPKKNWISIEITNRQTLIFGSADVHPSTNLVPESLIAAWDYLRDVGTRTTKVNRALNDEAQSLFLTRYASAGYPPNWDTCVIRVNGQELWYRHVYNRIGGHGFLRVPPPSVTIDIEKSHS